MNWNDPIITNQDMLFQKLHIPFEHSVKYSLQLWKTLLHNPLKLCEFMRACVRACEEWNGTGLICESTATSM